MTNREEAAAEFLEADHFRHNAYLIIYEMENLHPLRSELVDEVLHSIFFLGRINTPRHSPQDILSTPENVDRWMQRYPRPFQFYTCQLPKRSPFSCLLDMVVRVTGQQNENQIINWLQGFINERLRGKQLVSSTICVSQKNTAEDSVRYYGVSMSTSDRNPRQIIIAASCLNNWDSYVADAVMTYYPSEMKKKYFDGTIRLPEQVRCEAFSLRRRTPKPPCRSCANMFGLTTTEQHGWSYGNCAEAESLSNLLKNDSEVRRRVEQHETCTRANRQKAKQCVCTELGRCLGAVNYQWTYTPQL